MTVWPSEFLIVSVACRLLPVGVSVADSDPAPTLTENTSASPTAICPLVAAGLVSAVAPALELAWSSGATGACSWIRARSSSVLFAFVYSPFDHWLIAS